MFFMRELDFTNDLEFLANRVTDVLNIFNNRGIKDNQLVVQYGKKDFLSLKLEPMEDVPFPVATLRLRTRDMASTWRFVPEGFAMIDDSKVLFNDMLRAAHPSPKRNSLWYIESTIKDIIGDRILLAESSERRGYLFKAVLSNGFEAFITLTSDEDEYKKDHAIAELYSISNKTKDVLSQNMTADECLLVLVNMAMQNDKRSAEFVKAVEEVGGKTSVPRSYRLPEESCDEVKAVFKNGYALKFKILNDKMTLEVLGRMNGESYFITLMEYDDFDSLISFTKEITTMDPFQVSENNEE